jgi:hypothetical protein
MRWLPRLVLPLVALAIGCASTGEGQWTRASTTDEQRERDKSECLLDATETVPGAQGPRRRLNHDRYQRCMQARGYQLGPATTSR